MYEDVHDDEEQKDEEKKKAFDTAERTDKSLLKSSIYAFIGNLCVER